MDKDSLKHKILYGILGIALMTLAVVTQAVFAMPNAALLIGILAFFALLEVL